MKQIITLIFLFPCFAFANNLTAKQIMVKSHVAMFYPADNGIADVQMVIKSDSGKVKERSFVFIRNDESDGGNQSFLLTFVSPMDIKGVGLLVHKHPKGSDKRWLYMPSLDKIRRIGISQTRSSFMNSDYFYEDISGRNPNLDVHEVVTETKDTFVIKSISKEADLSLDYFVSTIDKKTFLPLSIKYYAGGSLEREFTSISVMSVQGFPTIIRSSIHDFVEKSETQIDFMNLRYNVKLPKGVFAKRFLRNPRLQNIK